GRHRAELVEQRGGQLQLVRELVAVLGKQLRQHVPAVEPRRAHPGQVIESDLIDDDALRLDAEPARKRTLEADRDVAEADSAVTGAVQHARREPADDLEPLAVDVVQPELVDVDSGEPRHEFRGVGRTGADDGEFQPFTPVSVTPSTKARCARKKSTITGAMTSSVAAIVRFHCTWCSDRNSDSPSESTQWCGFSPVYKSGRKKSLNV